MDQELARSERHQHPLSLAIFDIDDFKKYNDSFGHDAGNIVLAEVASLLKEQLRQGDLLARFGGEEFVLLMPETNKKGAFVAVERIRQSIAGHNFPHRQITVSVGIATFPEETQNSQELFQRADQYLYQAKACGKNCCQYNRE